MRTCDSYVSTKPIVASSTNVLTWTNSEIPSNNLVKLCVSFTSTGGTPLTLTEVTRLVVKANNVPIYDLTALQLRAFLQRFSKGGYVMPVAAITSNVATATNLRRITIPFYIPDAPTKDLQDLSQFPINSAITVEITWVTGAGQQGAATIAWMQSTVEPQMYPTLLRNQMSIAASASSGKSTFTDDGIIEGVCINSKGLGRLRLVLSGTQVLNLTGQMATSANAYDANSDSLLWEMQQDDCDWSTLAGAALLSQDACPNDPVFIDVHAGLSAALGSSFVELTTLADWAGVANELLLYSVHKYAKAG